MQTLMSLSFFSVDASMVKHV